MKISKSILSSIVFIAAAAFLLCSGMLRQTTPAQADLKQTLADWERAKAYTKEYLDASNDDAINFKPTAEMRTFGQQMLHLAEANYGLGQRRQVSQQLLPLDRWKSLINTRPRVGYEGSYGEL